MKLEFNELENRLRARGGTALDAELGSLVLQAVVNELAGAKIRPRNRWSGLWPWAGIAAAMVLVLNFSFVSTTDNGFSVNRSQDSFQLFADLRAIQQIELQQERIFK